MDDGSLQRLLILFVRSGGAMNELMTGLLDAGLVDATILEAKGLGTVLQQDMPIFAGLAALLPKASGARVILSPATDDAIAHLRRFIEEMREDDRPGIIVLPTLGPE